MVAIIANKLPENYDPLADNDYMSPEMLLFFKEKLQEMLVIILQKENEISHSIMGEPCRQSDHVDQGILNERRFQDFSLQKHEDILKQDILEALDRIEEGNYGYCKETKDPIGVKRLLAQPAAKYSLEIQDNIEKSSL